jgi:hypothetical protein
MAAGTAQAQSILMGVKGGVPATEAFHFSAIGDDAGAVTSSEEYVGKTRRFTIGPWIELGLPLGLAVEFDALYRRVYYEYNASARSPSSGLRILNTTNTADRWEFPLLVKYRFPASLFAARPYASVGASVSRISGEEQIRETISRPINTVFRSVGTLPDLPDLIRRRTLGFVAAGGVELRLAVIRLSPEIRYTRWGQENFQEAFPAPPILRSNLNQVDFLLGLTF